MYIWYNTNKQLNIVLKMNQIIYVYKSIEVFAGYFEAKKRQK
jgi:hypothetical protein